MTTIGEQIAQAIEANMPGDATVNARSTQHVCKEAARIAREFAPAVTDEMVERVKAALYEAGCGWLSPLQARAALSAALTKDGAE